MSQLIGKDPDTGKDWRHVEKGKTEDEMVGWHHLLNGHEFEQALGIGDVRGSLACCSPWGRKESDMTEWLNNHRKPQSSYGTNITNKNAWAILHNCKYSVLLTQIHTAFLVWIKKLIEVVMLLKSNIWYIPDMIQEVKYSDIQFKQ